MPDTIREIIEPLMHDAIGTAAAKGVFRALPASVNATVGTLDVIEVRELRSHLETSGRDLAKQKEQRFTISIDRDVLVVQRATQALTSELTRNISMYALQGHVTFRLSEQPQHGRFEVEGVDSGPGIPHLERVRSGSYKASTGLGRGRIGTRALLDDLHIESATGLGTRITGHRKARKT